jgi:hypothetical protein
MRSYSGAAYVKELETIAKDKGRIWARQPTSLF